MKIPKWKKSLRFRGDDRDSHITAMKCFFVSAVVHCPGPKESRWKRAAANDSIRSSSNQRGPISIFLGSGVFQKLGESSNKIYRVITIVLLLLTNVRFAPWKIDLKTKNISHYSEKQIYFCCPYRSQSPPDLGLPASTRAGRQAACSEHRRFRRRRKWVLVLSLGRERTRIFFCVWQSWPKKSQQIGFWASVKWKREFEMSIRSSQQGIQLS